MAQRPKARPKSRGPKDTDKKQFERFVETARKVEADESGKAFELAFEKIVPAKHAKPVK
jgi:hypothetical protein